MKNRMFFIFLALIVMISFGCVNNITLENETSLTLGLKVAMGEETVDSDASFTPGDTMSVKVEKGSFKAVATGTNYNETIEQNLNGSGTYQVEFTADGATMWKRVSVGY